MTELKIPVSRKEIEGLHAGDVVYLSGLVYTARDGAYKRALSGEGFPVDLRGGCVFHAGPIVKKEGGKWQLVAVGPTTSSRMNALGGAFIDRFKPAAIIGKGGMDPSVSAALVRNTAVYLAMTGGCAASAAERISGIDCVYWLDLGVPEAVWALRVENFGPLVVAMDSHGRSIYEEVGKESRNRLSSLTL